MPLVNWIFYRLVLAYESRHWGHILHLAILHRLSQFLDGIWSVCHCFCAGFAYSGTYWEEIAMKARKNRKKGGCGEGSEWCTLWFYRPIGSVRLFPGKGIGGHLGLSDGPHCSGFSFIRHRLWIFSDSPLCSRHFLLWRRFHNKDSTHQPVFCFRVMVQHCWWACLK